MSKIKLIHPTSPIKSSISPATKRTNNPIIISIPKLIISSISYIGSLLRLSFNLGRLEKLSSSLLVSNNKIKSALNIQLPYGGYEVLVSIFKEQYRNKKSI